MQLSLYEKLDQDQLTVSKAKKAFMGKVYYVFHGRNAWYGTWITRYTVGCMHTSLNSAKNYAEQRRKQGNVLYITELPALIIESIRGHLIITEINTNTPLAGYRHAIIRHPAFDSIGHLAVELSCASGVSINAIAKSFDPLSANWVNRSRYSDSVIILGQSRNKGPFEVEPFTLRENFKYTSISYGSQYRLRWRIEDLRKDSRSIQNIVKLYAVFSEGHDALFNQLLQSKYGSRKTLISSVDKLVSETFERYRQVKQYLPTEQGSICLLHKGDIFVDTFIKGANRIESQAGYEVVEDLLESDYVRDDEVVLEIVYPSKVVINIISNSCYGVQELFNNLDELLRMKRQVLSEKGYEEFCIIATFWDGFIKVRKYVFSGTKSNDIWNRAVRYLCRHILDEFANRPRNLDTFECTRGGRWRRIRTVK